ncbi:SIR2 family protein [Taibaiella koreensis]|uniref:hypothetical protein n=1 Tax=Taibaiella koreensis TaxID=1268548 RepID=UPI000E59ECC3|nr:hypothetical protein [Taibaiella koreensis]
MTLNEVIDRNAADIAFIAGNGINRFPNNPKAISWDDLLLKLWKQFAPDRFTKIPKGVTLTEFYDLLDIANSNKPGIPYAIQKEAARLLSGWSFLPHHAAFIRKAHQLGAPVLTTNFDLVLPETMNLRLLHTSTDHFTDFYPWTTYYSDRRLTSPAQGFGIWYINGFVRYPRSIRLGLSHYMGSVEKARAYLHKGGDGRLFGGESPEDWRGAHTWLHILFHRSLCIFGLGLEENEVFLRWLLIERAKYYKKFPARKKKGWYVAPRPENPDDRAMGKMQFLQGMGFELVEVDHFEHIYDIPWRL